MDLGSIVPSLLSNFAKLLPLRAVIIHSYEQGVKFRFGQDINRCSVRTGMRLWYPYWKYPFHRKTNRTGIHIHWAWFEAIEVMSSVEKVMETEFQTVPTADDNELSMSLAVRYAITNARLYFTRVDDFELSMENICASGLTNVISQVQWKEVVKQPDQLHEAILDRLNERVGEWGVEVYGVSLVNCSRAKVFRLMGEASSAFPIDEGE